MINEENLFFIIGQGRSGTSILQHIMQTFYDFSNKNFESKEKKTHYNFWDPVILENDFSALENFIERNWTNRYFVEKTPISIYCLAQLHMRFPNSNYIFLERDPNDIVLSQITLPTLNENLRRQLHLEKQVMEPDDLHLNKQQYWA